jgi:hypothetical protein
MRVAEVGRELSSLGKVIINLHGQAARVAEPVIGNDGHFAETSRGGFGVTERDVGGGGNDRNPLNPLFISEMIRINPLIVTDVRCPQLSIHRDVVLYFCAL